MTAHRIFAGGDVPPRIMALPRDKRGYPVPKFVKWIDDEPNFAVADADHLFRCVKFDRCWICGEPMGSRKAFVIGPMCCINRTIAEPPSHYSCARFAALNCPFLTRPLAKRATLDDEIKQQGGVPGIPILRNPGVCAIWITRSYRINRQGSGLLFHLGEPERVEFYANGRRATRAEIDASIKSGLPILEDIARQQGAAGQRELDVYLARFTRLMMEVSP